MRCYVTRLATAGRCRVPGYSARLLFRWHAGNCARLSHDVGTVVREDDTSRVITPVEKLVIGSIKATGPISIAQYMHLCLGHPIEGYYMKGDVFGEKGDFITSPEISQTFGELLAIWFISQWEQNGRPARTRLVELGPGRGTLLSDMLRTFLAIKAVAGSLTSIHMVENSPVMRELQKTRLESQAAGRDIHLEWHNDIEELEPDPQAYTMLVAHEFFDAMPVHMIEKAEDGWREVMVDLARPDPSVRSDDAAASPTEFSFRFAKSPPNTSLAKLLAQSSDRYSTVPNGSRIEVSVHGSSVAQAVAKLVGNEGRGAALIIDYGDDHLFGSSLRAFRKHKHVDLFESPGNCDITANVDFAAIREAVSEHAHAHGPLTQRQFLMSMGLSPRLQTLLDAAKDDEARRALATDARRLVHSSGMGEQYKVMAITGREEVPFPFHPQGGSGEDKP